MAGGTRPILNGALVQHLRKSPHLPALDAIRGLAACLVVVAHIVGPVKLGGMAVLVFFVLSGFLITWLLLQELERSGGISIKSFYIRRTLRIFPAFYVFWIVCVAAAHWRGYALPWAEALSSLVYLGDYYTAMHASHAHQIMGITWSLGVEEKFYLLWPALFLLLCKDLPKLLRGVLIAIALLWLYRVVACLFLPLPLDYLRYSFDSRFADILVGCALALALKLVRLEPLLVAAERVRYLPVLWAVLLAILVFFERHMSDRLFYIFALPLTSLLVAVLLLQLVFLATQNSFVWLERPLFRFLGRISYSLYLYHIVVIATVEHFAPHLRLRWADPLMFVGSIAVAYLSYRLVEQPFLRLKNYFEPEYKSRSGQPIAIAAPHQLPHAG